MTVVTFVSHEGEEHVVPLEEGQSLMRIAVNNAVPGIDADCGGEAAC
ncbi:2Fe-2S ferredoxin, partial [Dietzia maris]